MNASNDKVGLSSPRPAAGQIGRLPVLLVGAAALVGFAEDVRAQSFGGPEFSVGVSSDDRRRGLSWSGGRAALDAAIHVPLGDAFTIGAEATTLRGSRRHGGADAGIDLNAGYRGDAGPWQLSAGVVGHLFPGEGRLNYTEAEAGAGYLIGPAQLGLHVSYAPSQAAIGGDNLYLGAGADVAVPGTPFTLIGGVGRSSGSVDNVIRALRLRPGGTYWDYRLAVEHVRGPLVAGLRYTDTSIDGVPAGLPYADRHHGARVAAYLRLSL